MPLWLWRLLAASAVSVNVCPYRLDLLCPRVFQLSWEATSLVGSLGKAVLEPFVLVETLLRETLSL